MSGEISEQLKKPIGELFRSIIVSKACFDYIDGMSFRLNDKMIHGFFHCLVPLDKIYHSDGLHNSKVTLNGI